MSHAQTAEARLHWTTRRDGHEVVISLVPPRRLGGRGFVPVDVMSQSAAGSAALAAMIDSLQEALRSGPAVAVQGFSAPREDGPPLTFTLAVSLAAVTYPEASELPGSNVASFELPCGPGIRIHRLALSGGQPEIPQFTATYLAQTEPGILALSFATPHLEGAPEFAVLFDVIARSCTVTTA